MTAGAWSASAATPAPPKPSADCKVPVFARAGAATGGTVIAGHLDSAVAGEGALFHLADLRPGDPIHITTGSGTVVRYQVQARRVYVKADGLPAEIFDQQIPGRLVLISCGGPFDAAARSDEDNIVVSLPIRS